MNNNITGPRILISIPEFAGFMLTETVVITWIVMALLVLLCRFLTRGMEVRATRKRQIVAEWIVTALRNMVGQNMGERYVDTLYVPLIGAMFALSAGCSLSTVTGLVSLAPTCDLSTVLGWALLVFAIITVVKIRTNGFVGYLKGFTTPLPVMTPFNIIGEVATPISMALRHFGNIASGAVITMLIYGGLSALSSMLFGLLPGTLGDFLSNIPLLSFGVPAVLSLYFDFFSSLMQAFIFCTLTTIYVAQAAATD